MLPENRLANGYVTLFKNTALVATGVSVKGAPTEMFYLEAGNTNATAVYIQLYNKATAPTVGTDTPVQTYLLPSSAEAHWDFIDPKYFNLGLGIACTTTPTGSIAPGSGIVINIDYK